MDSVLKKKERKSVRLRRTASIICNNKTLVISPLKICINGLPGGSVVKNLPANAGDTGSSPGLGRSHMPRSN